MAAGRRFGGVLLLCMLLVLVACTPSQVPISPTSPPATRTSPPTTSSPSPVPSITPTALPPFLRAWQSSGHANPDAPAFRSWVDSETEEIPAACARCHSTAGFLDYLGADGSQPGVVDAPALAGSVLDCETCHNDTAETLDSAVLPSGVELQGLGQDALCVTCHQGRSAGSSVAASVKSLAQNGISPALEFVSIHYQPAGAVLFGSEAAAGYEFAGRSYAGRFSHVPSASTCRGCHDPHDSSVRVEACAACHPGANSLQAIRDQLRVSTLDYDADGDMSEGLALEIDTLRGKLLLALQAYGSWTGNPLTYDPAQEPFFFAPDGSAYRAWTPILLEAAYNLHLATMDPGAYAHNPKYMMQLLYDSILVVGGDISGLIRP